MSIFRGKRIESCRKNVWAYHTDFFLCSILCFCPKPVIMKITTKIEVPAMSTEFQSDHPKPIITPKQVYSPELEQTLIALELAEATDDPLWMELALTVLEDMDYIRSAEGEKLKERLRQEMNS